MKQTTPRALLLLHALLLPAGLWAQTPPAATEPAASAAQAAATPASQIQPRFEPGQPSNLPIQTCELETVQQPRPHTIQLPAQVKISLYDLKEFKKAAVLFDEMLKEPKKLEAGFYVVEVEGHDPIYVAYGMKEVWQVYMLERQPGSVKMGPFLIPSKVHLPVGQYKMKGTRFEFPMECRFKERVILDIPTYEGLPPVLEPGPGIAW